MPIGWKSRGRAMIAGMVWIFMCVPRLTAEQDSQPAQEIGEAAPASPGVKVPSVDEVVHQDRPAIGSRVVIGPDEPVPPGTSFRWKQVEGPPVVIDDPAAPKIRFTVPPGSRRLAFLLTVRDDRGERTTRVIVPVSSAPAREVPALEPSASKAEAEAGTPPTKPGPVADAGDDQIGLVGRRITLNGSRSHPRGRIGFRWMHLSGPAIAESHQEGPFFSFVPTAPGVHRFALIVGSDSEVSEHDVVLVEVGKVPDLAASASASTPPMARWVTAAVASIPQGAETSSQVADVMEAVAQRVPLYNSFAELQNELIRRLDVVIPSDPSRRNLWVSQVFLPLSQVTTAELLAAGIDPRLPSAADQPLASAQKDRLQTFFSGLAGSFRTRPATP